MDVRAGYHHVLTRCGPQPQIERAPKAEFVRSYVNHSRAKILGNRHGRVRGARVHENHFYIFDGLVCNPFQ